MTEKSSFQLQFRNHFFWINHIPPGMFVIYSTLVSIFLLFNTCLLGFRIPYQGLHKTRKRFDGIRERRRIQKGTNNKMERTKFIINRSLYIFLTHWLKTLNHLKRDVTLEIMLLKSSTYKSLKTYSEAA